MLVSSPGDDRPSVHAHKMVVEVAKGLAAELYEQLMSDNEFRKAAIATYPDMNDGQRRARFVARILPRTIAPARTTLALMLRTTLDERLKEDIVEALSLDATLVRGRAPAGAKA